MYESPWAELLAWIALPLALFAICGGIALAAERLLRVRLPGSLLVPAGLGPALTIPLAGHVLGLAPWAWTATMVVVAATGLMVGRKRLGELLRPGGAAIAALGTYLLYLAPVVLSGAWTWAGYNFLNDTSVQFLLTSWIQDGSPTPRFPVSTPGAAILGFVGTSYPMGTHALLASLDLLVRLPTEIAYQPFLSALAAIGALALYGLVRATRLPGPHAAGIAVIAMGANLTYQYALQGSIKEIGFIAALMATAALSREALTNERPVAIAVLWGLAAAGALAAYSAAALPYLAILGAGTVVLLLLRSDVSLTAVRVPAVAVGAAAVVIASLPSIGTIVEFARLINGIYTQHGGDGGAAATPPLGQLLKPLPAYQGLGVWLSGQYIFDIAGDISRLLTKTAAGAIALFALLGGWFAVRRREPALLLAAVPAVGAFLILTPRVTPYADAKVLALGGPAVLAIAFWALARLARGRMVVVGTILAAGLAGAVIASDAMAIHDVKLAPPGRMNDLRDIGDRYAGRGPILSTEFEEFAKYYARDANYDATTESATERFIELRNSETFLGHSYDLDEVVTDFVTWFPYVLTRRGPATSRPPADYRLDYGNDSYQMWRRRPSPTVLWHMPLGNGTRAAAVPRCREVRALARSAPAGARFAAAEVPDRAVLDLVRAGDRAPSVSISPGWIPDVLAPDLLWATSPGRATGTVRVQGGRYRVWVKGSFPRAMSVRVGGRSAGSVHGVNTPRGWLAAGWIDLRRARVRVELTRGGGSLRPGDGARTSVGAVALARAGSDRVMDVPLSRSRELCGRSWDWIEVVHP